MTDKVCVGAIAGAFGVRGEVRLKSFTALPEDIAAYGALTTEDGGTRYTVTLTGQTKNGLTVSDKNVAFRTKKKGHRVSYLRTRIMTTGEDFWFDVTTTRIPGTGPNKITVYVGATNKLKLEDGSEYHDFINQNSAPS